MTSADVLTILFCLATVSVNLLIWLDARRSYAKAKTMRAEALAAVERARRLIAFEAKPGNPFQRLS